MHQFVSLFLSFGICLSAANNNSVSFSDFLPKDVKQTDLKLYVITSTTTEKGGKFVYNDILSVVQSDYFKINLGRIGKDGKGGYRAENVIEEPSDPKNFKSVSLIITDMNKNPVTFKSPTDFLNYMSARNYELATETTNRYGFDYTFKKRKKLK